MLEYFSEKLLYDVVTIDLNKVKELEPHLNFLFIVHNEIEMHEMQRTLQPLQGFSVILDYIEDESLQHFFIGKFFKYNIVLVKTSDMGSINVNSVINVINRGIQIFRPRYIIMPGIAAGMDDDIKIGDVVIADKVIGYESEKIAPIEIIGRYPEFRSPRLFNLFCSVNTHSFNVFLKSQIEIEMDKEKTDIVDEHLKDKKDKFSWNEVIGKNRFPLVFTGNYISGEKLLDNPVYRGLLKLKFKEAKALDMEGVGIASASTFNRVYDWLVIKGISDLGDGNKGSQKIVRQIFAMRNVIMTLKYIFNDVNSFPLSSMKQVKGYNRKNVLISGSQYNGAELSDLTSEFIKKLTKQIIKNNYNILTGYGVGIGPAVLYGIFEGCHEMGLSTEEYTDRFQSFAFPREVLTDKFGDEKLEECKRINREILCANAKIAIFVFGNKKDCDLADGMIKEMDLMRRKNALLLPVGCTKGTAHLIYEKIIKDDDLLNYIKSYFTDRSKFRSKASNADADYDEYMKKLDELDKIELKKESIDSVVQIVMALINLYG